MTTNKLTGNEFKSMFLGMNNVQSPFYLQINGILIISIILSVVLSLLPFSNNVTAKSTLKQFSSMTACNCSMDYVSSIGNNLTGLTLPRINIIKNETQDSETEGRLIWTTVRSAPLMYIISGDFLLGNLSGGTSLTVALNTLNMTSDGKVGLQATGGSVPNKAKVEIVKVSSLNENGTLRQVKLGEKISEIPLEPKTLSKKATSTKNIVTLQGTKPGYYLLAISLSYSPQVAGNISNVKDLTGIYESLLKVQ